MVSSICLDVMLKDSCGSPNLCLMGGVPSDPFAPSLCAPGGLAAAVATGFLRCDAAAVRWTG
jgi:hypothetical protein